MSHHHPTLQRLQLEELDRFLGSAVLNVGIAPRAGDGGASASASAPGDATPQPPRAIGNSSAMPEAAATAAAPATASPPTAEPTPAAAAAAATATAAQAPAPALYSSLKHEQHQKRRRDRKAMLAGNGDHGVAGTTAVAGAEAEVGWAEAAAGNAADAGRSRLEAVDKRFYGEVGNEDDESPVKPIHERNRHAGDGSTLEASGGSSGESGRGRGRRSGQGRGRGGGGRGPRPGRGGQALAQSRSPSRVRRQGTARLSHSERVAAEAQQLRELLGEGSGRGAETAAVPGPGESATVGPGASGGGAHDMYALASSVAQSVDPAGRGATAGSARAAKGRAATTSTSLLPSTSDGASEPASASAKLTRSMADAAASLPPEQLKKLQLGKALNRREGLERLATMMDKRHANHTQRAWKEWRAHMERSRLASMRKVEQWARNCIFRWAANTDTAARRRLLEAQHLQTRALVAKRVEERHRAAASLQRVARGMAGRRWYSENAARKRAAMMLQCAVRNYHGRKVSPFHRAMRVAISKTLVHHLNTLHTSSCAMDVHPRSSPGGVWPTLSGSPLPSACRRSCDTGSHGER